MKILIIIAIVGAFVGLAFAAAVFVEVRRLRAKQAQEDADNPLLQMFAENRAINEARRAEAIAAMPEDDPLRPWVERGGGIGWMGFMPDSRSIMFYEEQTNMLDAIPAVQYSEVKEPNLKKLPTPGIAFGVDFTDTPISKRLLGYLSEHPGLAALNLFNHLNIADDSMKTVARMTDLQMLELRVTEVTGVGLVHLSKLANLRYLAVTVPDIETALPALREMSQLVALVGGSSISAKTLRGLAPLTNLRHLEVSYDLTNAGIVHLRPFQRLLNLKLSDYTITDEGLLKFPDLGALQTLELSTGDEGVRGSGLVALTKLLELRNLLLVRNALTGTGFEQFRNMPRLATLDLSYNPITEHGFAQLRLPDALQTLTLSHTNLTDAGIARLELPTSVTTLNLTNTQLTDASISHLARFSSLTYMNIMHTNLTLPGAHRLADAIPNCQIQTSFPN